MCDSTWFVPWEVFVKLTQPMDNPDYTFGDGDYLVGKIWFKLLLYGFLAEEECEMI